MTKRIKSLTTINPFTITLYLTLLVIVVFLIAPSLPRRFNNAAFELPGSSAVEQVAVNHFVAGSIPARAAIRRAVLAHGLWQTGCTAHPSDIFRASTTRRPALKVRSLGNSGAFFLLSGWLAGDKEGEGWGNSVFSTVIRIYGYYF